jgi:signal transduction histidine kinase
MEQRLRQQLARELHDGPVQLVSNATMNLMVLQKQLERDPKAAQHELTTAIATMQHALQQMRALMFELRPMVLENEGLGRALEELSSHLRKTTSLKIELDLHAGEHLFSSAVETNIYYIIQEAVQNTLKHARATRLQIRMNTFDEALHVSIRDDGRGFDLEHVRREYKTRKSLGLVNLYERAEMIDGHIAIDSLPGHGTTVRLTVPLPQELR